MSICVHHVTINLVYLPDIVKCSTCIYGPRYGNAKLVGPYTFKDRHGPTVYFQPISFMLVDSSYDNLSLRTVLKLN